MTTGYLLILLQRNKCLYVDNVTLKLSKRKGESMPKTKYFLSLVQHLTRLIIRYVHANLCAIV